MKYLSFIHYEIFFDLKGLLITGNYLPEYCYINLFNNSQNILKLDDFAGIFNFVLPCF